MLAAQTLPANLYRDPRLYERERTRIFARGWLLLAHESQLPAAGDYFATCAAGYPLILVRCEDGAIRAFHNMCRHRAGPLAEDGQGNSGAALICRYHGWRYTLDGRLASARDFGPAEGFDPRDYGLIGVACESWRGFVFANIDGAGADFAETIGPLARRTVGMTLESFRFTRQSSHEIRCNWKTYVENYLEGYHIPLIHPGLDAAIDSGRYETEICGPLQFYYAPPRAGAAVSGLWAWLWPCLGINVYAQGLMMERMWPIGHTRTRLDYLYFFPPDTSRQEIDRAVASSETTTAEDIAIVESVQRNLDAGVYERGRLSPKHEDGVAWFQSRVLEAIGTDVEYNAER
jgi:choline monooxygenase